MGPLCRLRQGQNASLTLNNNYVSSMIFFVSRIREERGDAERALALDHKVRELNSQNGKFHKLSISLQRVSTATETLFLII